MQQAHTGPPASEHSSPPDPSASLEHLCSSIASLRKSFLTPLYPLLLFWIRFHFHRLLLFNMTFLLLGCQALIPVITWLLFFPISICFFFPISIWFFFPISIWFFFQFLYVFPPNFYMFFFQFLYVFFFQFLYVFFSNFYMVFFFPISITWLLNLFFLNWKLSSSLSPPFFPGWYQPDPFLRHQPLNDSLATLTLSWQSPAHAQSCLTPSRPTDCSLTGSSVHRTFQARVLEWVAISSSMESSRLRDWTLLSCVSCLGRRILYPLSHRGSAQYFSL